MFEGLSKYKIKRPARESIEAEEIFLDSEKLKKSPESEKEKIEFPVKKERIRLVYFLIVILLLVLLGRSINLQIVQGKYWLKVAEENRIRAYPIKPLRGIIYDKNKKPLVSNEPIFSLSIIPSDLIKQKQDYEKNLEYLSKILSKPKQEIDSFIKKHINISYPIVFEPNISQDAALILKSRFSNNPAILVEINSKRQYYNGYKFFHLLGYLGSINEEERKQRPDYFLNDYIGKSGIELYYENQLRGEYGKKLVEVDANGEIKRIIGEEPAIDGKDIILAIDSDLQEKLYDEIKKMLNRLSTDRAAAIAVDPRNGKILALLSFPSLDNNKFSLGLSGEELQKISQNPSKPFLNRIIAGLYPPGSTVKPIIAAAALKEKIIEPEKIINCHGSITVRNKFYPNIFRIYNDWKAHGPTNLIKAIAESCDVYFYTIGGGYGDIKGLGVEKINQYFKQFGLGMIFGIDLKGEVNGLIPDEEWKIKNKKEKWYLGDTYNISIGQGDLLVTPLQLTMAISAIANGGTLYKPQLVEQIGENKIQPQKLKENVIDKNILKIIKKGMREAVVSGSARYLYDLPIKAAGKTGTAQAPGNKNPHGWFTVFAPYENPEIVLTILIENGGEGSSVAVPIAKEVLKWYFNR